ncbi:zinc finger HIT domain-containing protein 2 [Denticeps clupeoides]|uniref:HIT-type domain-containing protein n=1 Tax=Denticeps clupeoides TaxID=299321 RepID=A0AAY4CL24_9TELE|nr:zinc finger HIT domain-containing protein 2 [Denticeps clupeoides]XP_028839310.1 zinc finger HIT domain-containing protein 2 [Denticeps clupeoides]
MDLGVRRRLPACVRTLLTDIAPREEERSSDWTDSGPEPDTADRPGEPPSTERDGGAEPSRVCGLCLARPHCYTCPRCNIPYCSLACYRSAAHCACSEEFYKESVFEELRSAGMTDEEGRAKMQQILLNLRQEGPAMGDAMGELEEEEEEGEPGGTRALELLSRLAEIQASGEENRDEVENILKTLEGLGKNNTEGGRSAEEDEDEEEDLAERLAGLDIDSLSEEELWALLSRQERAKFEGLVKGGAIGGLIPAWTPWWERHDEGKGACIEVLEDREEEVEVEHGEDPGQSQEEESVRKRKKRNRMTDATVPSVSVRKIPPLHSLSSNPSPLSRYTLVNVLYGYTFSLSLFNGDISEEELAQDFCQAALATSDALSSSRVFSTVQEALEAGVTAVSARAYFDREDAAAPLRTLEAVAHVLMGKNRRDSAGYTLAALSQLRGALAQTRRSLPKEGNRAEERRRYFQAGKKCEFLQSWVKENGEVVRRLAAEVWREHRQREGERRALQNEKRGVEESWKKGRRRGGGVLIEEIK